MRAWFVLFGFGAERVDLEVCLAIPDEMVVMFDFMKTIAL